MYRASWPTNPFDALAEKPAGYTENGDLADVDGEWTFFTDGNQTKISHQRADNSRHTWDYNKGTQDGDDADVGSLGTRVQVAQ